MDLDVNRITGYFDAFRSSTKVIDDAFLDHVIAQQDVAKYKHCKDVPKETFKSLLSELTKGTSCSLTSDQEDDIMRALTHHSLHGKVDLDIWKTCFKYWTRKDTSNKSALIAVDVQNDFISGTLSLKNLPAKQDGEDVVPVINKLKKDVAFDLAVFTLDWHPCDHCSYHSNVHKYPIHETSKIKAADANMYDVVVYDGDVHIEQTLWPIHCEQGSWGAKLHVDLKVDNSNVLVYKGSIPAIDSYSAFWDNGKCSQTKLFMTLLEHNINHTFICGLATDFCVLYSAVDSAEHGFQTYFIEDASRGVSDESIAAAKKKMADAGVKIITTDKVAGCL